MDQSTTGQAAFVKRPRTYEDLICSDETTVKEMDYQIFEVIQLDHIDYENFITDMVVSRDFLSESTGGYGVNEKARCVLVLGKGFPEGILVVPDDDGFVEYAAVYK